MPCLRLQYHLSVAQSDGRRSRRAAHTTASAKTHCPHASKSGEGGCTPLTTTTAAATTAAAKATTAERSYTADDVEAMTEQGNKDKCFIALFAGKTCGSAGGVYQIAPAWTTGHLGGSLIAKKTCGNVIDNWLERGGSHAGYVKGLENGADINGPSGLAATYLGKFDCAGSGEAVEPTAAEAYKTSGCEARRSRRAGHAGGCITLGKAYLADLKCGDLRTRRANHAGTCATVQKQVTAFEAAVAANPPAPTTTAAPAVTTAKPKLQKRFDAFCSSFTATCGKSKAAKYKDCAGTVRNMSEGFKGSTEGDSFSCRE